MVAEKMLAIREEHGRGSGRLRARHGCQQHPYRQPPGQSVRHSPNVTAIAYFCYGPQGRRLQGDGQRRFFATGLGHDANSRRLRQAALHRAVGLAETHQQRSRSHRAHSGHRRAAREPGQHRRRPAPSRQCGRSGPTSGCRCVPAPTRRWRSGWMRVIIDEELYDREFVEKALPRLRRALVERVKEYPLDKVAEITWCDAGEIAKRGADLRHDDARLHPLGQWHRSTRQQYLPSNPLSAGAHGHFRESGRSRRQRLLSGAETRLSGAVGQVVAGTGGQTSSAATASRRST